MSYQMSYHFLRTGFAPHARLAEAAKFDKALRRKGGDGNAHVQ